MKTMSRILSLALLVSAFALAAFAQTPAASPDICTEDARTKLYTDYYNKKKGDAAAQKEARDLAGQYVDKYGSCNDKYTEAVKHYIELYDKAQVDFNMTKAYSEKRFADVVTLGRQALAANPDNVKAALLTAWSAYSVAIAQPNNTALNADAISAAQKALQLLDAGKTSDSYAPFSNKDDAASWMNFALGALNLKSNPETAVTYLVKVAQSNGAAKQEPRTYSYLGYAYQQEWAKLNEQYKTFKEVNDQSRIVLANMNLAVDRIIDAYARAVAYSTKPEDQQLKAESMKLLTDVYKSQHNGSDAGLNEMVASITTKPLLITTPVTTPPPADTSAPGTTTSGDGAAGTTTPPPAGSTTTPANSNSTKPPATPPPGKKPPVKLHHG